MTSLVASSEARLLKALACQNFGERPPVWLMRQAGRSLPEYRILREKYSLEELFRFPELICAITKQPIDRFGVDGAILFADILHIPLALGLDVSFPEKKGPVITPILKREEDFLLLHPRPAEEALFFVKEGIRLLKEEINVPLIGFCGGPFTVMTYMVGKKVKKWLYSNPESAHKLLQIITDQSIDYLKMQVEAGVQALQIFDSWANLLSRREFSQFASPYLQQIVEAIDHPIILFSRASSIFTSEFVALKPQAISFDWTYSLDEIRSRVPETIGVQGNLDPEILYASPTVIQKVTEKMLQSMEGDPGYIVNLGHGVLPDTPVDHIHTFIETVQNFSPRGNWGHGT